MSATMERTTTDAVAATEQGVIDAEVALDALQEQMRRGVQVKNDAWQRAEADVRFARARRDAAVQAATDREEQERADRIAAFRASIPGRRDPAPVEAAREQLAAAIDRWVETCGTHDRAFSEVLSEITAAPDGPIAGVSVPGSGQLVAEGRTYRSAPTQRTIRDLASAAIARHYGPRQQIRLDQPPD